MNENASPIYTLSSLTLKARRLGLDTHKEMVAVINGDCILCKSAGFRSEARVNIQNGNPSPVIATLFTANFPNLAHDEIGLSDSAWHKLGVKEGEKLIVTLSEPIDSFAFVRAKLHGKTINETEFSQIIHDMVDGYYSNIQLAAFITACVNLSKEENIGLTKAMSASGRQLKWTSYPIVDKHCVGGLPGNRTSMILVPIIAAFSLIIPKTSSRAITSPAGTADVMNVLTSVNLSVEKMRDVVEQEGGCIVWGGSVELSPVDDVLVQVERALDLDSKSQLIASVLSKKVSAGSTYVLIDMPVGPTAKVRSAEEAAILKKLFAEVGSAVGLNIQVEETDGSQPIGFGIGPALEARDVLAVLRNEQDAPKDLKEKALRLSGEIIDACGQLTEGTGYEKAVHILESGRAYQKFMNICKAQGGFKEPELAAHKFIITSHANGVITNLNNRLISRIAKLAGAPDSPTAGIDLHISLQDNIEKNQPLMTIYSESIGQLHYALHFYHSHQDAVLIEEN